MQETEDRQAVVRHRVVASSLRAAASAAGASLPLILAAIHVPRTRSRC